MRKYIYNTVVVILLVVGVFIVILNFCHFGNVEFTDNARVRQHITPQNTRVQGFIKEVRFEEFQKVSKGDTLVVIEDAEFRLRLAQAEADTAFQNVVKILGGFAALEDPKEGTSLLLKKFETNIKLCKLNEQIRDMDGEIAFNEAMAKELEADDSIKNAAAKAKKALKNADSFRIKREKLLPEVEKLRAVLADDTAQVVADAHRTLG